MPVPCSFLRCLSGPERRSSVRPGWAMRSSQRSTTLRSLPTGSRGSPGESSGVSQRFDPNRVASIISWIRCSVKVQLQKFQLSIPLPEYVNENKSESGACSVTSLWSQVNVSGQYLRSSCVRFGFSFQGDRAGKVMYVTVLVIQKTFKPSGAGIPQWVSGHRFSRKGKFIKSQRCNRLSTTGLRIARFQNLYVDRRLPVSDWAAIFF